MNKKIIDTLLRTYETTHHDYRYQVYGLITPRKHGEFSLVCYAVTKSKRHGIQITEVNRAWSDRPYYQCKNIWKNMWGSTMVEFNERRNRPQESYGWYGGKWGAKMKWSDGESWFLPYVKYLNLDALAETKYKYCAYDRYFGDMSLMAYCRLFRKHKEIEFLSKSALWEFINTRFLDRMEKDKGLRNFFRSHHRELIQQGNLRTYSITEVTRAYKNGWTLQEAHERQFIRYAYKDAPKGIDKLELHRYLQKNDIDYIDWKHYADDIAYTHGDILAFGTTYPRDFHEAVKKAHRRVSVIRRKEQAEYLAKRRKLQEEAEAALKRMSDKINRSLERMADRLAWRVGEYVVIIPTTQKEFREEGRAMGNCIGGYYDKHKHGETFCFFIRKNDKRLADVEMNPKSGIVKQCRIKNNDPADDTTLHFAQIMAKKFATSLKTKKAA